MTGTISTTYPICVHYTILSNPHSMTNLYRWLLCQISQVNSISRTYFCTFRTLRTTISTFVRHLGLHQMFQITGRTQYLIRAHRHTKLTSRTVLRKMTETQCSRRNNRSGTLGNFLIYKRSQTAIHFLFLSFYGNTCSNQSRNRKEPTPCSIYLFFV